MKHADFHIGCEFLLAGSRWRCTDIGARTICAIKLDAPDTSWYRGPPYAVEEHCLDEYALEGCERPFSHID